jgi:O-antigen ligase
LRPSPHILFGGLYFYSLLYLSLSLPFQRFFTPIVGIVGVFLGSIYFWNSADFKKRFTQNKAVLWFAAWWLLYLFGVAYSDSVAEGLAETFRVLPILTLPISIAFGPPLKGKSVRLIFRAFVASVVLSLLLSEVYGVIQYIENRNIGNLIPPLNYLYYAKLAQFTQLHTSYYALYTATAFFILLWDVLYNRKRSFWNYFGLFFLFLMMFIISARTQIAAFILAFTGVFALEFYRRMGWKKTILSVFLLFLIFAITLLVPRRTRERIFELQGYWVSMTESDTEDYRSPRFYIWEKAWETFRDSPLIGHGTSDGLAEFHNRVEASATEESEKYTLADLEASDLRYKNDLIRRFHAPDVRDTLSQSFGDGNWKMRGEVELNNRNGVHFDENNQDASLAYENLRPGAYYYYEFKAKNRLCGGFFIEHAGETLHLIREEAKGTGLEVFGYVKAKSNTLLIGAAEDMDSQVDLNNPLLIELSYQSSVPAQPVPAALDNPIEVLVREFHVHSQFLDAMLRFGILGLFLLVLSFGVTIRTALKNGNTLFVVVAGILLISLIPEHMMSRQAGLFFIAYFMSLTFLHGRTFLKTNSKDS